MGSCCGASVDAAVGCLESVRPLVSVLTLRDTSEPNRLPVLRTLLPAISVRALPAWMPAA